MLKALFKDIHESWMVASFCVGVVAGMVVGLIWRVKFFDSPIWIIVCGLLLIIILFKSKLAFVLLALMSGVVLAFFRISVEFISEDYARQFEGQMVVITGTIDGDPETDEQGTKLKLTNLGFGEEKFEVRGSIYISLGKNESLKRSDLVTLSGKLESGFGTFVGYMYKPVVLGIRRPEPGDLILRIRNWFARRIARLIPEPENKLGLSYLLGMKAGLPDDLSDNLRLVGLVHIVVASGAHLSILVEIARKIFGKILRFSGLLFSVLFIIFFMIMVGFTPSILRAGVMSILTLLAWYVGRKFAPWRIILLVAAFTLMLNPMFLINLGWLLSFASYAGIMILGPQLNKFFYGDRKPGFLGSTIITTISATLMTLPIILYYYGMISLISLVANLLILPTLSYAMGLVFLTGVVFGIPGIETLVSFLATKLLDFHIFVVGSFAEMRSFLITIEPYNGWVFLIYFIIAIGLFYLKMVELKQAKNKFKREKICLDIVNGQRLKGKKR